MKHTAAETRRIRAAFEKALPHLTSGLDHLGYKHGEMDILRRRLFTAFKRGYNTCLNDVSRETRA